MELDSLFERHPSHFASPLELVLLSLMQHMSFANPAGASGATKVEATEQSEPEDQFVGGLDTRVNWEYGKVYRTALHIGEAADDLESKEILQAWKEDQSAYFTQPQEPLPPGMDRRKSGNRS